jgi:hypothetical protein
MYTDFFENIYRYFFEIYELFTQKKNKSPIHKYEKYKEYDDEEYLYFNQADRDLIHLNESKER